jgi:hypothetical protein
MDKNMLFKEFLRKRKFVFGLTGLVAFFLIAGMPVKIILADSVNLVPNPSVETQNPANASAPLNWVTDNWGTNKAEFT